eukprot:m.229725 g.229725  ORF g.229725 m.229725 type:complete len:449 (-) comp17814_c0_seq1:87-1433(-)
MKIVVVGGGLVGSLQALYMARRGHEVHVFEARQDVRTESRYSRQSINLALSARGRAALDAVGLESLIVKNGIEMHSRYIHGVDGHDYPIRYGEEGQNILAIDRRNLNERLLDACETQGNVKLNFQHKLVSADVDTGNLSFSTSSGMVHVTADLILGADGAYSALRREIMRKTRMDFSQMYIPHAYKELQILPGPDGESQIPVNFLHIWPRHAFMMIALPNLDKSWTLTLFMPWNMFDAITTPPQLLEFFGQYFPDAIPLIGKDKLVSDFFTNPTSSLITIKCNPYHAGRCVILGDAAHAMVPFYGQGMNAGFEDVQVFSEIFDKHDGDVAAILAEYSAKRHEDAHAICDLALNNYVEMRASVTSTWFLFRKKLDNLLHRLFPSSFIPLYTMVTFSRIPYSDVIRRAKAQDALVRTGLRVAALGALTLGAVAAVRYQGGLPSISFKLPK